MIKYRFRNKKTKKENPKVYDLTMDEMEGFLEHYPDWECIIGAPGIHSGLGMKKPDDGFRDVLKNIKKQTSKGIRKSTVNTF
jgi:hypothetical protein